MGYDNWFKDPVYKLGKSTRSHWQSWYDDYDFSYSRFSIVKRTPEEENKIVCEDSLKVISRSANAILNSGDGQEKRLVIKYSDGSNHNNLKDGVIYISPDPILREKDKEARDVVIDATCGQVMLSAQLRRNVDPKTYTKFIRSEDHDVRSLWSAIETAVARADVVSEWSGFKPYFDTYSRHSTNANSTAIKRELSAANGMEGKQTSSKAFIKGLSWNLYHSHDPVKIPAVYNDGKTILAEGLANVRTCQDRWELCERVVEEARRLYDANYKDEEDSASEHGDDEFHPVLDNVKGIIPRQKGDPGYDEKKRGSMKFDGIDEALFGLDAITNDKCSRAAEIASVSGDKASESKDLVSAPEVSRDSSACVKSAPPVWLPADKDPGYLLNISAKIGQLDKMAENLQDSFSFRTKEPLRRVYGCNGGTLHNRSLYKAGMDLDTVFYRKSKVETDRIAMCILLDQSGSMSADASKGSTRIKDAAAVGYVLAKLCKMVKGIDLSIVGFSAQENSKEASSLGIARYNELDLRMIYDQTDGKTELLDILEAKAHSNNTDGFAIWYTARHLSETREGYKRKIMVVVSDGTPNASGYGGHDAMEHVAKCKTDAASRFGVETYAIGVAEAYSASDGNKMYGKGNNIIIKDVSSSLGYISRFLAQLAETNV